MTYTRGYRFGYGYDLKPYIDNLVNNGRIDQESYTKFIEQYEENTYYEIKVTSNYKLSFHESEDL